MLVIEQTSRYLVPLTNQLRIVLVGCGGTGSCLAPLLARLAHEYPNRIERVHFIDGDTVEAKNIGRQLFAPAEVGLNKAVTLANRLNRALGLRITAHPTHFVDVGQVYSFGQWGTAQLVIVGAVDTVESRRSLMALTSKLGSIWLDCGNHEHSGQVVVGTTTDAQELAGSLSFPGLASELPAVNLVYPQMFEVQPAPAVACAEAVEAGAQALFVNQLVASVAAQYLYQMVAGELKTYRTTIDTQSLTMSSQAITPQRIAADCGIPIEELTTKRKGKR